MKFLITPILVEFEWSHDGVQMVLWADTHQQRFQAKVNGTTFLFGSTSRQRYIRGLWVQGFLAFPEGSKAFQEEFQPNCPEAYLGGSLRLPLEDSEAFRPEKTCRRILERTKEPPSSGKTLILKNLLGLNLRRNQERNDQIDKA